MMKNYAAGLVLLILLPLCAWADAGPDTDYPLIMAVWADDYAQVQTLLKQGNDPNTPDKNKDIALCHVKSVKMAKLLLQYNADIDGVDGANRSGLLCARNEEIARFLVESGADLHIIDCVGGDVINNLLDRNWINANFVTYLIAKGADARVGNDTGTGALFSAAYYNYPKIARILLDNGADPNQLDASQKAPYQVAAERGNSEVMAVLKPLTNKKHQTFKVSFDEEIVSQAVLSGSYSKLEKLLKQGLDINTRVYGEPLLHQACLNQGDLKMAKFLVSKGADLDAVDAKNGMTALAYCLTSYFADDIYPVCVFLIEQGAKLNVRDNLGRDLQEVAQASGNDALYQKLLPIIRKKSGE